MLQSFLTDTSYLYLSHGVSALSACMLLAVALPLVKSDYWLFRALEYPRFQKFMLSLFLLALWLLVWEPFSPLKIAVVSGLLVAAIYQTYKIWPYTRLAKREMLRARTTDVSGQVALLCFNVLQDNRAYSLILEEIRRSDPDVIFLLETDHEWENAMRELENAYSHTLKKALDNTYGLLFYSRLPLEDAHIRFLADDDIPSVEAKIILPSGARVQLWGLHPKPPAPKESLTTTAKDKELMKVALKAKESPLPVIVIGDLNDVAWSYTTELFRKTSGLLDPRRGRGFYSTFSAKSRFMRFPLDYIFCSKHFGLVDMRRLSNYGSDHFAMFIRLQDCEVAEACQEAPEADQDEKREARRMAAQRIEEE
ncbi:MAG: endonuclease/exonuclease/phosphatase family protein [Mucilaginibacter polytrichastri]|nr:endonuclease/exonuclease/phosphatase family protein [Mucilaginibacter polytrichastri]